MSKKHKKIESIKDLGEGIWLVHRTGFQRIAKLHDACDRSIYANMASDIDVLATYLRVSTKKYISDSIVFTGKGSFMYNLPGTQDMAESILRFLSLSEEDREVAIDTEESKCIHINSDGDVVDDTGHVVYHRTTPEAVAEKIKELKKSLEEQERLLGEMCLDGLTLEKT